MNVTAKSNIQHDGQLYTKGQSFEVNEKQAADLLAAGVIESVAGLSATEPEEAPEKSLGTTEDAQALAAETAKVAATPIKMTMKKTVLIGIARANGLEVEKTATPSEVYKLISEYRAKNNIVIDGEEKPEGDNPEGKGEVEELKPANESATPGANAGGEPEVPANPAQDATSQNTTDTEKEPAPAPAKPSKSK